MGEGVGVVGGGDSGLRSLTRAQLFAARAQLFAQLDRPGLLFSLFIFIVLKYVYVGVLPFERLGCL